MTAYVQTVLIIIDTHILG